MNKKTIKTMRRMPAAAIAAAIVFGCGSITAAAAWRYLAPEHVAKEAGEMKIADAFLNGDAISVNEVQRLGGYDVTLLGLVSGEDLSMYPTFDDYGNEIDKDKTYSVVAIQNSDGTPMPKTSDDAYADLSFFVSPLIKDYNPNEYNAVTMRGSYTELEENGVLYRIAACDNVEMFADHGLYLCVCDGTFYNNEAYLFDEATGEISRNEAYSGLNALFDLPIDASKANPAKAADYLTSMEDEENEDTADTAEEPTAVEQCMDKFMKRLTPENIDEYAKRIESSVQICKPDAEGYISYSYGEEGMKSSGSISVAEYLSPEQKFVIGGYSLGDTLDDILIHTFELNDDGSVTYAAYVPKKSSLEKQK